MLKGKEQYDNVMRDVMASKDLGAEDIVSMYEMRFHKKVWQIDNGLETLILDQFIFHPFGTVSINLNSKGEISGVRKIEPYSSTTVVKEYNGTGGNLSGKESASFEAIAIVTTGFNTWGEDKPEIDKDRDFSPPNNHDEDYFDPSQNPTTMGPPRPEPEDQDGTDPNFPSVEPENPTPQEPKTPQLPPRGEWPN